MHHQKQAHLENLYLSYGSQNTDFCDQQPKAIRRVNSIDGIEQCIISISFSSYVRGKKEKRERIHVSSSHYTVHRKKILYYSCTVETWWICMYVIITSLRTCHSLFRCHVLAWYIIYVHTRRWRWPFGIRNQNGKMCAVQYGTWYQTLDGTWCTVGCVVV